MLVKEASPKLGSLAKNGIIYIEADQQFDAITPQVYRTKKKLPNSSKSVVYMLNGCLIPDTLKISKAAIRRVDLLLGLNRSGLDSTTNCLSIWTLTNDERSLSKPKNVIRIRGDYNPKAVR